MNTTAIYSSASEAQRYSTNATYRQTSDLFVKAQQLQRLAAEIAALATEIVENGNAPSREAAQQILAAL
jgi:hypothetical protein